MPSSGRQASVQGGRKPAHVQKGRSSGRRSYGTDPVYAPTSEKVPRYRDLISRADQQILCNDLNPASTIVQFLLSRTCSVHSVWRNPTKEQQEWGLPTTSTASYQAAKSFADQQSSKINVGSCSVRYHARHFRKLLAAADDKRINELTFMVCVSTEARRQ